MSTLPTDDPSQTNSKRPSILVVDDDEKALRLLSVALAATPFEIETVASGKEAMKRIAERVPELMVLDFEMPDLDGAEICAQIRRSELPEVKNLPIVMLTAHTGEAEELKCLDAGANDFVTKPVSAAVLQARISTQLRLRSHVKELERWNKAYEADLACARSMQQGLVPQMTPAAQDWQIQARYAPLIEVGGDMYGWESLPDDRLLFWMADGIGHGTAAALITALVAHLFSKHSELAVSPSEVLARVNRDFIKAVSGKSFMTACCAIVENDGSVVFSGVGNPPLLVRRSNGKVESFASDKAMLGVDPDLKPSENAVSMSQGDTLLLYTDGLHSRRGKDGEKFGPQVVEDALADGGLAEEMITDLMARISSRSDGSAVFDDLAVIALRRLE
jgi:serine phosphatase RsbU (regulator of sigma subunit)